MMLRPSTTPGPRRRGAGPTLTAAAKAAGIFVAVVSGTTGCASSAAPTAAAVTPAASGAAGPTPSPAPAPVANPRAPSPPPLLRGARCPAGQPSCACRKPGEEVEKDPPAAGMKRLEVRLSFFGGKGALASPNLGLMPGEAAAETCYYVDVPVGSVSPVRFEGQALDENTGFTPHLTISEYGPGKSERPGAAGDPAEGPFWYEVLTVDCVGVGGRCDGAGSAAWAATLKGRKRGRIDPCGSMVVTHLTWDTSGGLSHRDNGFFRDFQVAFDLEAKKFTPVFPPHSTECVPK